MKLTWNKSLMVAGIVAGTTLAGENAAQAQATPSFNFETGNAGLEVVVPTFAPTLLQTVGHGDATLILRDTAVLGSAWFDSIAPYHPTAVGIYSRLGRRPNSERATNKQRNIALLYASFRALNSLLPQHAKVWQNMLSSVGLDPNNASEDLTTPAGIGNVAGKTVVMVREHDGMNQLGDEGGRDYNKQPYADYTGYKPVNTPYAIVDAGRWQPNMLTAGNGLFRAQQFVTPQIGITDAFTFRSASDFRAPVPTASNPRNFLAYKAQADEILAISAGLTDEQKAIAELFDHKFNSLAGSSVFAAQSAGLSFDQTIQYEVALQIAAFDGAIVTWNNKYKYDAPRPFTAIRYLYADKKVTAWGGPGQGTVNDITGNEWRSYLNSADHPEYPSGSSCFCAAQAELSRGFLGSDKLDWTVNVAKGSSFVEPGVTPKTDVALTFATWTDFETKCRSSRLYAGVHFRAATEQGAKLCRPIGKRALDYLKSYVAGRPRD